MKIKMEYEIPAPGFRFYPTEDELVSFYLKNKLQGKYDAQIDDVIPVLNIYDHNPPDLPQLAGKYNREDTEQWFFFIPMQDREAQGGRPTRLTTGGFWKATGSLGWVYSGHDNHRGVIGAKRTMVFYTGRAPNGTKTEWKMNEYRCLESEASNSATVLPQEFSLCRVYKKQKCPRAFDRRPPAASPTPPPAFLELPPLAAAATNEASMSAPQQQNDEEAACACPQDNSFSSPLEHGGAGSDNGGDSWDLSDDVLWEWDQFNLF